MPWQLSWYRVIRAGLLGGLLAFFVTAWGCEEALTGPRVLTTTIEPDRISETRDSGMTDEFFTVNMQVTGFESEIQSVVLFAELESEEREHPQGNTEIDGESITVDTIPKTWFRDVPPGEYDIGATIESERNTITQRNLTQVEVFSESESSS